MTESRSRLLEPRSDRGRVLSVAFLALGLAGAGTVRADIIFLKNGNQLQGEILERNERRLTVRFPNGIVRISTRDVDHVESENHLEYLLSEGERHLRRSDFQGAISYFEEAIENSGGGRRARNGLVQAHARYAGRLREERRLGQAAAAYQKLLSLRPDDLGASRALEEVYREAGEVIDTITAGRQLLERGQFEEAYESLRKVYKTYPDRRSELNASLGQAAMRLGHAAYSQGDGETAERHYLEALGFDPDLLNRVAENYATIKISQLQTLVQNGDLKETLRVAHEAKGIVPTDLFIEYYRGLGLQATGKRQESAEIFLQLSGMKRPRDLVDSIGDLRRATQDRLAALDQEKHGLSRIAVEEVLPGDWRRKVTEHFVIYHRNHAVGKKVAQVAEQTYGRLLAELGSATHWYRRCQIYIFPTAESFRKSTGVHNWTGGAHQILRQRGTLSEHRILSYQNHPRLFQIIVPHEIAHAMLEHHLRYRGEVPRWLSEGFAMRAEPRAIGNYYKRVMSQTIRVGRHFKLIEFLRMKEYPTSEEGLRTFYAQSFSLWSFLERRKGGLKRLLRFTEELSLSPKSITPLLKRHYGIAGPIALENLWRGYVDLEL